MGEGWWVNLVDDVGERLKKEHRLQAGGVGGQREAEGTTTLGFGGG